MSLALAETPSDLISFPERARAYPRLRYMGSKHKLLPWIWETLANLDFDSALDLFSGTASVAYLMKAMGKRVMANDFLNFAHHLATATIENSSAHLDEAQVALLCRTRRGRGTFIEKTFQGIFFEKADLRFLDIFWSNLDELPHPHLRALALASATRACLKRQPRGVFTVNGGNYDDGRRDLRLSLEQHFAESVAVFNDRVFDNGRANAAVRGDAFSVAAGAVDLVYMDPPYVPRADDNCYIKRYHFLEGLASYWREPGTESSKRPASRRSPNASRLSRTAARQKTHSTGCFTGLRRARSFSPIRRMAIRISTRWSH
jgi:DNA adenine methylase/adenine-specific DNA-methyltransferase